MNPNSQARPGRTAWTLFAAFLLLYLATIGGHLYSPDEELLFRMAQSLARARSLAVEPLFGFATRTGTDGREYAQYGAGQPLAALPFYLLGQALQRALPPAADFWRGLEFTFAEDYHGERGAERGSYWLRFGVALFNPFVTAALVAVVFLLAFEWTGDRRAALLAAILFGAGSIIWPHSKTFFTETPAALCVTLAFLFLARGRRGAGLMPWALAGFCAGYAVFTRVDSLFLLPGVLLYFALCCRRTLPDPARAYDELLSPRQEQADPSRGSLLPPDTIKRGLAFGVPLALFAAVLLGINHALYGSPLATGYSDQSEGVKFATPLHIGLYGFLFSFGKGFFFFSPGLILFFFAFRKFWERDVRAAVSLALAIASFLLIQSKWQNWGGGWCWGPRHIVQLAPLLALPAAALLIEWRKAWVRVLYVVLLLAGAGVQLYACSQSFIDFYWYCYRPPFEPYTARLRYSPVEDEPALALDFLLLTRKPAGEPAANTNPLAPQEPLYQTWQRLQNDPRALNQVLRPISFAALPAPLAHSFWVPEHTPWYGYAALWRERRRHDFFWLHALGLKPAGDNRQ